MDALVTDTTPQDTLLASDLFAIISGLYFLLFLAIYVSFVNICEMDEREFKNGLQTSFFNFKRKICFIFSCSGNKTVFSKKTFILEIVGYFVALTTLVSFIISLFMSVDTALILLIVSTIIVMFIYGIIVAALHEKAMKKARRLEKEALKKLSIDEDDE